MVIDPGKIGDARKAARGKVLGADVSQGIESATLLELQNIADPSKQCGSMSRALPTSSGL
jgi:hypothetical protein